MAPDGYVEIKDRPRTSSSRAENISSLEVEEVLTQHPAVMIAAVVARPDPTWGETPCAFLELKPDAPAVSERDRWLLPRAHGALKVPEEGGVRPSAENLDRQDPKFVLREQAKQL